MCQTGKTNSNCTENSTIDRDYSMGPIQVYPYAVNTVNHFLCFLLEVFMHISAYMQIL